MVTWKEHTFEEARHPTSGRKVLHCTVCDQYWTGKVRVDCPGIPVLRSHDERYGTKTQLASERLYPPDEEQPDATYRTLNAPYYGWLYDRTKAIARPLTEGQVAGNAKREETIRKKYGCRFCSRRYTKKHHEQGRFEHGTCDTCRARIKQWNDLLTSCQDFKKEDVFVVQVETVEPRPLVKWGKLPDLTLTGVEVWPLSMDEPLIEQGRELHGARAMLRYLLDTAGLPLLFPCGVDQELAYNWLYPDWNFWENVRFQDFRVLSFSYGLARPLPGQKDWYPLRDTDYYQPKAATEYYQRLNELFELGMEEPLVPAHVARRIVLSLAEQEPIAFP